MLYLQAFIISVCLSFLATLLLRHVCYKYNLLAYPRSRDSHKTPLPRIGGLAIFVAFALTSIIMFLFLKNGTPAIKIDIKLIGIFLGACFITLTMLLDDLRGLSSWKKLLIQVFVSIIVISFGVGIDYLTNPFGGEHINLNVVYIPLITIGGVTYHFSLISDLLTLIWLVGMMNVINFVDGVDGLASGFAMIASFTIFLLSISLVVNQPSIAMIAIILSGSVAGFLFWNFPPAKIFMGDSGSMFLGFMLGVLPLVSGGKLATAFLVLGFPIIDGLYVAISRLVKGKNPMTSPDKTHLHHRFLNAGFSTRSAILSLYAISAAFGWVALRSTTAMKLVAALILVISLALLIIILNHIKFRKKK